MRNRLARLRQASLRINETIDLDAVLQELLDSACSGTGARYGVIVLLDSSSLSQDLVTHGLTPEELQQLKALLDVSQFFRFLNDIEEPLRLNDFGSHARAAGLPEFHPPVPVSSPLAFLGVPVRHLGERVGVICLAEKEGEFAQEDEDLVVAFSSQAGLAVANARRHQGEQRARDDLQALANTAPMGVLVFDGTTGEVTFLNGEALRLVDVLRKPNQSLGQFLGELTFRRADGREVALEEVSLTRALQIGETVRAEEILLRVPDGRSLTLLVNATPIRSENGDVASVVATVQDLTALEELERMRVEFLGMVSQELRVPLSSIKGSAATLLGETVDLDPAEMRQFLRLIDQQADRMRDLIGNLLDFARIYTGTLPITPEPTEVTALVEQSKREFVGGGGRNNVQVDLSPDLPWVMADRRRVVQVIVNLLSNAAQYSHESLPIRVTAAQEGFFVAFSVVDEGRGLSDDDLPNLFRKFSQMSAGERERGISGSGLGLAICRGIVEAHGGRIWAESEGLGSGSLFTFTVPVADVVPVGQAHQPAPYRQPEEQMERILVVDSDSDALRYVRDALSRAGYSFIGTGDQEEAMGILESESPHLVLLDHFLPEAGGLALMRAIVATSDVPVIFLSAHGREEVISQAFDLGAADYMVKPFSPTELEARVRAALRGRSAFRRRTPTDSFVLNDLSINYPERRVTIGGQPVQLTATEYQLLLELSVNAGVVLTYEELLQRVWGLANSGDFRLVRGVITRLRRKLGDDAATPKYILTEIRVGYRMVKPEALGD